MDVIDRESPQFMCTLYPPSAAGWANAEFDRDRRHVLVSVRDDRGALTAYITATPEQEVRSPMREPSGKYDV